MIATKRAQVRDLLEERITTTMRPGDVLASERALVAELGVSRVTVRHAIEELVDAGMLERTQGKGTYVTGPRVNSRLQLTSFSREMRARGLHPATHVMGSAEIPADSDIAAHLDIAPGAAVVRVERLRLADGTPMAHEVGYYPSDLFPGLIGEDLSALYDVFARVYGVATTSGEQVIRAEAASAEHARVLDIPKRAPLLVQERTTYSHERAMEFAISWYRGDRYRLHSPITPRDEVAPT